MNKKSIIISIIVLAVGLCLILPLLLHYDKPEKIEDVVVKEEPPVSIEILCAGDVMVHKPQIPAQYQEDTGTYNFDNNFEHIKKYIEASDFALCNLETTFAGGVYTGYPVFNAPEALADSLKTAGFDVAFTSNNHIMDKGLDAMKRTLEITRQAGLETAGTNLEGEKNYTITEVKGLKFGLVAYTYQTPDVGGSPTINGNHLPSEAWPLLNTFSYERLDEDLNEIKETIKAAKGDGAELIICYYHWGEEYSMVPNDFQKKIAQESANAGADIIFGSHPHVLQGMEMLKSEETQKEVPVFYSMGNLLSNQRLETLDNRYTEQGMLAKVKLKYVKAENKIEAIETEIIPTWVDKYRAGGKDVYSVIPLDDELSVNDTLLKSGHLSRAQQALEDINKLFSEGVD